ncbi:sulfurtransferase [Biformimicrobium ophioploci]|uniref:Sulfurtransferase n=1 Tax=Biformimicrobium ophioploci TaxID=3036711 RepID=A0ABQ6M1A4_9GAMM|nr:sulfurtransferase [Microbulbifer sp. NKW57]GMG88128.1 sulfurtransferase [Microbulbifer sp. NKW57]
MEQSTLVTSAQLALMLDDTNSDVLVLDCRFNLQDPIVGRQAFLQDHIPGARFADLERDLSAPAARYGGRHPLPEPGDFERFMRTAGAGENTTVVVYDDQRQVFASRAWWLLRYFGHNRVMLLDGGYSAWQEAGLPVQSGQEHPTPAGSFRALPQQGWTLAHDHIQAHIDNPPWQLVDAREPRRFEGLEEPMDPLAGHIPTAVNRPWQAMVDEQGFMKDKAALESSWEEIPPRREIVCYCGSGVSACVNLLALHLIGREARLYPGSWSDWCAHILYPTSPEKPDNPAEPDQSGR